MGLSRLLQSTALLGLLLSSFVEDPLLICVIGVAWRRLQRLCLQTHAAVLEEP